MSLQNCAWRAYSSGRLAIEAKKLSINRVPSASALSPKNGSIFVARTAIAAFLLPSISTLLWWIPTKSALHFRGWVNAEFILLLALALWIPSSGMIALLTAELTLSLIEPIAHLYYFSPADALLSMKYLLLIPTSRLVTYAVLLLLYIVGSAVSLRMLLERQRGTFAKQAAGALVVCVVLLSGYDVAAGRRLSVSQTTSIFGDLDASSLHAVRMPLMSLLVGLSSGLTNPSNTLVEKLPSALDRALPKSGLGTRPNIVLILTESWGFAKDEQLNRMQIEPYVGSAIRDRYRVETGTVGFKGGTVAGEMRELCGESRNRRTSITLPSGYYDACWPDRLAALGYRTLAVHGFTPSMFNRKTWYRQMGFGESDFLPELARDGANGCDGAFPGACDADVAVWIKNRLLGTPDEPTFVHWVTLNSHLPLPSHDDGAESHACVVLHIEQDHSLCTWFSRVELVHESVARLAMSLQLRPTIFIIVGDHAPPFLNASNRDRFSQTVVPYVILSPIKVFHLKATLAKDGVKVQTVMRY